jgi:hypothetical protein
VVSAGRGVLFDSAAEFAETQDKHAVRQLGVRQVVEKGKVRHRKSDTHRSRQEDNTGLGTLETMLLTPLALARYIRPLLIVRILYRPPDRVSANGVTSRCQLTRALRSCLPTRLGSIIASRDAFAGRSF